MSKILLIRHGTTDWNIQKRIMGQQDIPLSQEGIDELLAFCQLKETQVYRGQIKCILSSPLRRAYTTAYALASAWQCPVIILNDLIERNFGDIEGLSTDEVSQKINNFDELIESFGYCPPGGETLEAVRLRVLQIATYIENTIQTDEIVAIVGHSIPLRLLSEVMKGIISDTLLEPIPSPLLMDLCGFNSPPLAAQRINIFLFDTPLLAAG